jgi:2-dehydro-3-deoxyphosphogluconate aldolase/(4S)-4-hydroxy-2-oxoglutarate aldolase
MMAEKIRELPIIGILRGIKEGHLEPLVAGAMESGLKCIEITMNTGDADKLIRKTIEMAGDNMVVGAGTVCKMNELKKALDAGAAFIVMPMAEEEIISCCVKESVPVFPGALTPTEIFRAWDLGATMVKVFPASVFGPGYFREIKAPFGDIELMATGGVSSDNIREYFACGASAAAFGASIFRKEWIENNNYGAVQKGIEAMIRGYKDWKSETI